MYHSCILEKLTASTNTKSISVLATNIRSLKVSFFISLVDVLPVEIAGDINNVVKSGLTFTYMNILTPQQKSPFDLSISKPANYDHYKLSLSYDETDDEPFSGLKIQGVTHHTDNYGFYYIDGEVKNTNTIKAKYVEIVATLYDSNGKIIYADFTFTNSDIASGQTSSFEFMIDKSDLPGSIYDFVLQVQASS